MRQLFIGAVYCVAFLCGIQNHGADKGLVGFWKFDVVYKLSIKDSSGKGNDAVLARKGKNTALVGGKIGKGMKFAADDSKKSRNKGCAVIKNLSDCDFTKGITIQAWIKFKSKRNGTREIVSNVLSDRGPGFRFIIANRSVRFMSGNGKTLWGAILNFSNKSDTWYFVAATYDGSVFKVYVYEPGVEAGSGKYKELAQSKQGLKMTKGSDAVFIGAYRGGYAYSFDGIVDEVKIYDYAKNGIQILDAAESTEDGKKQP